MTPIDPLQFGSMIIEQLPYEPTHQQVQLVAALARFYCRPAMVDDPVFILAGYAGTGKSSMVGAMVRAIQSMKWPVVLLAPTGRAAKVLSLFAGANAYTIHRFIYRLSPTQGLTLASNPLKNALFVVDEASMIGEDNSLLSDLVHYVYSGTGCRMLLLGDTAQLPPVGLTESPAMSPQVLRSFGLKVTRAQLTATVRQHSSSGVLHNATWLRHAMLKDPLPSPQLTVTPFNDIKVLESDDLEDALTSAYRADDGERDSILITRSNRRATAYNLEIRNRILGREEMITRGELLMVAKNNYHWTK
ncbi:MAG: AAA family ATPase, partial [Muribaculaceae bacterium]|nr:AAA family ATPase [Muribaculaceae bacterium]